MLLEYCNICKTETETAVVKQKRGAGGVYCMKCRSYKRNITPTDKKLLTEASKRTLQERGYIYNDDITRDHEKTQTNRA